MAEYDNFEFNEPDGKIKFFFNYTIPSHFNLIKEIIVRYLCPEHFDIYCFNVKKISENTAQSTQIESYELYIPFKPAVILCNLIILFHMYKRFIPFRKGKLEDILPTGKINNVKLLMKGYIHYELFTHNEYQTVSQEYLYS